MSWGGDRSWWYVCACVIVLCMWERFMRTGFLKTNTINITIQNKITRRNSSLTNRMWFALVLSRCTELVLEIRICYNFRVLPFVGRDNAREVMSLQIFFQAWHRPLRLHCLSKQILSEGQQLMSRIGTFQLDHLVSIQPAENRQILFKVYDST